LNHEVTKGTKRALLSRAALDPVVEGKTFELNRNRFVFFVPP